MSKPVLSIVLLAHHPFAGIPQGEGFFEKKKKPGFSHHEVSFFEALSRTYLPILEVFSRLEQSRVPFKAGMAFSPVFCSMLQDKNLIDRFTDYLDRKLEFGRKEIERCARNPALCALAHRYYEEDVERRIFFTEYCDMDILGLFRHFHKKGRIEPLTTAASYAFLPFYSSVPEAIRSQFETALSVHRRIFGKTPQGFWLPEFGWSEDLEEHLRSYGFTYTMTDAHALVLGNPPAQRGTFYPVQSPSGFVFLGRDYLAKMDLASLLDSESSRDYQKNFADAGFELSLKALRPFVGKEGIRCSTGYRYYTEESRKHRILYDPQKARERAAGHARLFLNKTISRLEEAGRCMEDAPLSLCAFGADTFGYSWHEGTIFLETLFREAAWSRELELAFPHEYILRQSDFQTAVPEFSSWEEDGYAENWLDVSSDWMYRHVFHSIKRMTELTERFSNDTGLKERALNQAAREILLALGSDLPRMLYRGIRSECVKEQIEENLRNFTTIFESLGSNYISTEWLTDLERRHYVFPLINYRVFGRKK